MSREWTYVVVAKGRFGGFEALLVENGQLLLVRALWWKGEQPRLALTRMAKCETDDWGYSDEGFEDWLPHLTACREEHTFRGNDEYAQNLEDQWLAHGRGGPN